MVAVVVVEDERLTRRAISASLRGEGFEIHEAEDAAACRRIVAELSPDVALVDLGLPDADGVALAGELRAKGDIGVIVVTRRSDPAARIEALDLGADDYLVKPVHFGELAARIRSLLRRRRPEPQRRVRLGPWRIDLEARAVTGEGGIARLTRGEFSILARLIEAKGAIVSRDDLLNLISRHPEAADPRTVDVLISRLRNKLGDAQERRLILTASTLGYQVGETSADP